MTVQSWGAAPPQLQSYGGKLPLLPLPRIPHPCTDHIEPTWKYGAINGIMQLNIIYNHPKTRAAHTILQLNICF